VASTTRAPVSPKYRSDAKARDTINSKEDIQEERGIQAELAEKKRTGGVLVSSKTPDCFVSITQYISFQEGKDASLQEG